VLGKIFGGEKHIFAVKKADGYYRKDSPDSDGVVKK